MCFLTSFLVLLYSPFRFTWWATLAAFIWVMDGESLSVSYTFLTCRDAQVEQSASKASLHVSLEVASITFHHVQELWQLYQFIWLAWV